jgi:hypothetical protein
MDRRFDDIVAFSELERFIDTPVKHYSSGMYARLGFSVAISVDPDLLIIDEVLSVGDEGFQRKCFDRIREFKNRNRTIIFVSHSLDSVQQLCDRVIWLAAGRMTGQGEPGEVFARYHNYSALESSVDRLTRDSSTVANATATASPSLNGSAEQSSMSVQVLSADRTESRQFSTGDTIVVRVSGGTDGHTNGQFIDLTLRRSDGVLVFSTTYRTVRTHHGGSGDGWFIDFEFFDTRLLTGSYEVTVTVSLGPSSHGYGIPRASCRDFSVTGQPGESGVVSLPYRCVETEATCSDDLLSIGRR